MVQLLKFLQVESIQSVSYTHLVWKKAPKINTDQYQTAWQGATGVGRMLWDDENLYVLIEVQDDVLDKSHSSCLLYTSIFISRK